MTTSLVLFTRDLRVHDHPALAAAAGADQVVPLFVATPQLLRGRSESPNRATFLAQSLQDLDRSLRQRGGGLAFRHGDPVAETMRLVRTHQVTQVHLMEDVGAYAAKRQTHLREACSEAGAELHLHRGPSVVPAGQVRPTDGDHFRVFTPYWRRWAETPWPDPLGAPRRLSLPEDLDLGHIPDGEELVPGVRSPALAEGGEAAARKLLEHWLRTGMASYDEHHDDLAADGTSHLSPHLHFGTISAAEVAARAKGKEGAEPFLRQLCWRDFHHQVLGAFPELDRKDYHSHGQEWHQDREVYDRWREGKTGVAIVDAGMRQLKREGWMHNRARLITGFWLTKGMGVDWRLGAEHFRHLLLDGDVANNSGNWQWVAGTGNDTRPYRRFNLDRQAKRFDPDGAYVERYLD